jgi:hypothetical protein
MRGRARIAAIISKAEFGRVDALWGVRVIDNTAASQLNTIGLENI